MKYIHNIGRGRLWFLAISMMITASLIYGDAQIGPEIRTPKPPATPRINGPSIFGVRPGHPFLYQIPATGSRPMEFSAEGLPDELRVDTQTGRITGTLITPGEYRVTLHAKNTLGADERPFRIVVGETIALTPPMGWNSWNCWGPMIDADKILRAARAMASSGLVNHGWTYINIDDAWQGKRGGPYSAIQGNERFPDMEGLCKAIHGMGLKVGIYSSPWITTYAGYVGGSSDNPDGLWTEQMKGREFRRDGRYVFADNDAKQWAAWGIDYLKYDWNPRSAPQVDFAPFDKQIRDMADALRRSGRDIVYSYSNSMQYSEIPKVRHMLNAWRTSGDIRDNWERMSGFGFGLDRWARYQSPGHWNDPDMMVVGMTGGWGGREPKPTGLTPDEQYTHVTLWCMVSAPLLLGCDLERLDEFTLNLLTNDEVLAVSQDALGQQGVTVSREGPDNTLRVYAKDLEDGSKAVGLFNLGEQAAVVTVRWADLKLSGTQAVRDVWRQKELGQFDSQFQMTVAPHGAELVRIRPASEPVHVLLVTGGHGFSKEPFFAMFDEMEGVRYTHIELHDDSEMFESIDDWKYDGLVLYNMTQSISPHRQANFIRLLEQGVGVVALHHSLCSFQTWPEYRRIIGGQYYQEPTEVDGVVYPAGTYQHDVQMNIYVTDASHPVTVGVGDFQLIDETYNHYAVEPDNHLLLTTDAQTNRREIGWVRRYKNANICYLQLGHGPDAYAHPAYRTLVRQAIRWSVTSN